MPIHDFASILRHLGGRDRCLDTGNGPRIGADLWACDMLADLWSTHGAPETDEALLRHLLSDDALGRFIAQAPSAWPFDLPIASALMQRHGLSNAGTLLVPDRFAKGVVLPSLVRRRNDNPIVVRGATTREITTRTLLLPETALDVLFKHAIDDAASTCVAVPTPVSRIDDTLTDLSLALTAATTDDQAIVRPAARRRRAVPKRTLWAAAAVLAAIAVIPALATRRAAPPASSIALATTPAPAKTPVPAASASITAPPAKVASPVSAPKPRATVLPAAAGEPAKAVPVQAPVAVADARIEDRPMVGDRTRRRDPQADANSSRPLVPVALNASPANLASTTVAPASAALPPRTAASRISKRKSKKAIAGRETTVASALVLPDVLKPH